MSTLEFRRPQSRRLAFALGALALASAFLSDPRVAHADRKNAPSHDVGLGFHTIRFRTENGNRYSLHGMSVVYDYWAGRRFGLMLHAETHFPTAALSLAAGRTTAARFDRTTRSITASTGRSWSG